MMVLLHAYSELLNTELGDKHSRYPQKACIVKLNKLTPWSLEKAPVTQLLKNFPTFHGT
jgi:hypothetical protein